jgi:NAD-dependent dihydropyrimidine dehydrogenase PreA subunit
MKIDQDLCIGCGQCVPYCPVGAIIENDEKSDMDLDECAECGNCLRMANCPVDAIYQQELTWPRTVRSILSDPLTVAEESGISGRGTEEMKTNEVTARFKLGSVGIGIEVGRPVTGARFYDVEKIAQAVAVLGVEFEAVNPTTSLMSDPGTGKFNDDVLNEKVLSAILEFAVKPEQLPDLFDALETVSKEIDAVFSLDVATRIAPDGSVPTDPYIEKSGLWIAPNGKTNVGLGKPRCKED